MLSFRKAVADWYKRRFNVTLDPADEVLTLIGSKEGIGHIHLAFVDPGDIVLVPSPGYPVYPVGTSFAGGISHIMPLTKDNGFLPDLKAIPKDVAKKAKLMWLNSPNNPTSVIMTQGLLQAGGGVCAGESGHRLPRRGLFGDFLRRQAPCELHGSRWREGRRHGIPLALEDLQHDRLAHRVCRRQQRGPGRTRQGEEQPRLRLCSRRCRQPASRLSDWMIL